MGSVASRPALPSRALIDSSNPPARALPAPAKSPAPDAPLPAVRQDRSDAESTAYDWLRAAAPPLPSPHLHHSTCPSYHPCSTTLLRSPREVYPRGVEIGERRCSLPG